MSQIIACGGGGFSAEPKNPLLDCYIIAQAQVEKPNICFLPTASGDNHGYSEFFKQFFERFPCNPKTLSLFSPHTDDIRSFILEQDIIYVGGGNTKTMLGIWREWEMDKILKEAWEKGVILAGMSAGSVCWFEHCVTDSIPGKYTVLNCLGLLNGSNCPHYHGQEGRIPAYHHHIKNKLVKPGYAADDSVALHFDGQDLKRVVSSRPHAKGYKVYLDDEGNVKEDVLETSYLGIKKVRNTLLWESIPFANVK